MLCVLLCSDRVQSYASSRAGSDAISTHISAVMSKRAASVTQDDVGVFQGNILLCAGVIATLHDCCMHQQCNWCTSICASHACLKWTWLVPSPVRIATSSPHSKSCAKKCALSVCLTNRLRFILCLLLLPPPFPLSRILSFSLCYTLSLSLSAYLSVK